ncbi:MAG: tetratricopeptide repeat protein [Acidobacteriota bacterium]
MILQVMEAKPPHTKTRWVAFVLLGVAGLWATSGGQQIDAELPPATDDPLAARGYSVTGGAASGYVDDRLCGSCHTDLFESYQSVGMARSFYRPAPEKVIEDFDDNHYYHAPSGRHYEMTQDEGRYVFRRYQLDEAGRRINLWEQEVDWILGSGSTSRTYHFRVAAGELYQLPLAWYSQSSSWGMAPGFDNPEHLGVTRRVRRECMFCHNAYPDVPSGSDTRAAPQTFPADLPQGIGCQRCHGPGAEHARTGMRQPVDFVRLAESIVNPADLPPRRQSDICYGCHMQPSVALAGLRRFGRGDYSFRPGEPLSDYLVQVDVEEAGRERSERFEINHHPYRLEQSRCFIESEGQLSCLTCHDPHRKVQAPERAAHYREACLSCHQLDDCDLESMTAASAPGSMAGHEATDPLDCAACHMPRRRTEDVVHVVMTDHRIQRTPGGSELVAPREETVPIVVDAHLMDPSDDLSGPIAEVYRAAAVLQAGGLTAVDRLQSLLAELEIAEIDPFLHLAKGQLAKGQFADAERTFREILRRSPADPLAEEWLGIAKIKLDQRQEARRLISQALEARPDRPEARFNLGLLLSLDDQPAEAIEQFRMALDLRPNMATGWFQLGNAYGALNRLDEAADSYRSALEVDPTHSNAYLLLGWILAQQGERDEARRILRHGSTAAAEPARIQAALERLTKPSPAGAARQP